MIVTVFDQLETDVVVRLHTSSANRGGVPHGLSDSCATIAKMSSRSDYALEVQLSIAKKEAVDKGLRDAVKAALKYVGSGSGRNRKGGEELVRLLEEARLLAADKYEWQVVRLLQDSLDYVQGRILKPEFEERYRLFQDGARNEVKRDYVSRTLWAAAEFLFGTGSEFLDQYPGTTGTELLAHLRSLGEDAKHLDAPEDRPGRYRILRGRAELAVWLERIMRNRMDIEDPRSAASRIISSPEALNLLADDSDGQLILRAMQLQRRSAALTDFRKIAEDPAASEHDLQEALQGQYWIFGGEFVGEAASRRLVSGDEMDIPLIRGDGALHVVELQKASGLGGPLVKRHRNAWVPTAEVNDAVAQSINYLLGLDENREKIKAELGIETRRASAVVLIGYPKSGGGASEEEISEVLRTLNTHLSRVEVLTYKELIDNAERSLGMSEAGGI
jgi:Domain of unknown function (DUF4263)